MAKDVVFNETIFSTVEPKRVLRLADECLLDIRLVESRKEGAVWIYEYDVKGQSGRIDKFLKRLKKIETGE